MAVGGRGESGLYLRVFARLRQGGIALGIRDLKKKKKKKKKKEKRKGL
jgi:hypothetical protein